MKESEDSIANIPHQVVVKSQVSLTANDGRPRPGPLSPTDPGPVTEHDEALLALVLHDVPRGELRLVRWEDDRVGGKTRESALGKLI